MAHEPLHRRPQKEPSHRAVGLATDDDRSGVVGDSHADELLGGVAVRACLVTIHAPIR